MAGKATSEAQLIIRARDETSGALRSASTGFSVFKSNIIAANQAMDLAIKVARGLRSVADAAIGMAKDAAEQERVFATLRHTIRGVGDDYDKLKPAIDATLMSLQQVTRFGDTDAAPVLEQLTRVTGDTTTALRHLELALDISTGAGLDAERAALLLGRALEGDVTALSRYVPQLNSAVTAQLKHMSATERTEFALGLLQERFGGLARAEGAELVGMLDRITNAWGDLREAVGGYLTENETLRRALEEVAVVVELMAASVAAKGPVLAETFSMLGQLAGNAFSLAVLEAMELGFAPFKAIAPEWLESINPVLLALNKWQGEARGNIDATLQALRVLHAEAVKTAVDLDGLGGGGVRGPDAERLGGLNAEADKIVKRGEDLHSNLAEQEAAILGVVPAWQELNTAAAQLPDTLQRTIELQGEMRNVTLATNPEVAGSYAEVYTVATEAAGQFHQEAAKGIDVMAELQEAALALEAVMNFAFLGAAAAAVAGARGIAQAFTKATQIIAGIEALFEVAAAIAAAARLDFRGAIQHAAAAAKFGALAKRSVSFGGIGGGGTATARSAGTQPRVEDGRGRDAGPQKIEVVLVTPNPYGPDEVRRFVYEVNRFGNRDGVTVLPTPTTGPSFGGRSVWR